MWLLIALAPAEVPAIDRAVAEPLEDRVGQPRPADRRRQPELVAAGQEDAGRVLHEARCALVVGLRPGDRVERADPLDAQVGEHVAVALAGFGAERRGGRDHRDGRVATAGQAGEAIQDDPIADLVLRAADDDDGTFGHGFPSGCVK